MQTWFPKNIDIFEERETSTPPGNGQSYIALGRPVPGATLMSNVPGAVKFLNLAT
ncbi:MAG: hypothetical protein ACE5GL_05065 [Calditrichia bacterium]